MLIAIASVHAKVTLWYKPVQYSIMMFIYRVADGVRMFNLDGVFSVCGRKIIKKSLNNIFPVKSIEWFFLVELFDFISRWSKIETFSKANDWVHYQLGDWFTMESAD